ncbi:MAG: hypothetical protein U0792_24045 [Gemmataceae bacterium]
MPPISSRSLRRQQILSVGSLNALLDRPGGLALLEEEARDPQGLITRPQLDHLLLVREQRRRTERQLGAFFSTDDVIVVPGFMGSSLRDETGPHGLIWIDPRLFIGEGGEQLAALRLASFQPDRPDQDAESRVRIEVRGAVPLIYDLLSADLDVRRYNVQVFPFDWRKNLELSAASLTDQIRGRIGRRPRPLHIIAHSQGSLVARRAIHLLGADVARRLVNNLVLLGPATFGSFSAAFAIAGSHESIQTLVELGVQLPSNFNAILRSFTGVYQLLPWKPGTVRPEFDLVEFGKTKFWQGAAEPERLGFGFGWGRVIDTTFFDDRTTIILGNRPTVGAVRFEGDRLVPDGDPVPGDGTVPDLCARLPGVRTFRADAEHMKLPLSRAVLSAVRAVLRGDSPQIAAVPLAGVAQGSDGVPVLREPPPPPKPIASPKPTAQGLAASPPAPQHVVQRPAPPIPPARRLRVFSFDPLLATNLDLLDVSEIAVAVRWEDTSKLGPGPVGEYLEVVDYDPASGCFYHPIDLSHPSLLASDGLRPSESNPQFHQQMAYAVGMATIETFEKALGRVALWAPRMPVDASGELLPMSDEERYIPRLRVYPHAIREANAFYDPDRHALLFGYFPSRELPGGEGLPGGTVFTCLSFDIVAHETTHALLHGLHGYYLYGSNPDVFAFHEAFADAVAVFQHFSHPDVVRQQVARSRGELGRAEALGRLARQFGRALGRRGGIREYIGAKPDPTKIDTTDEPHERGAILMAALFQAFLNIYHRRVEDLLRIATGGTGVLPDGAIHPDLVGRLADEAAKSARHLLTMCVRALDYVPPLDLTFGEYLRALITADYDLVRDDDRRYRVSVIDAFRQWGIYPADANVLDEAALRWASPPPAAQDALRDVVRELPFKDWSLRADRREIFAGMRLNAEKLRSWLYKPARELGDRGESLGLLMFSKGYHSVPRNPKNAPELEIHSLRPCCRIGPDGQQRVDLVAEIVQRRAGYFDPKDQEKVDAGAGKKGEVILPWAFTDRVAKELDRKRAPDPDFWFRGGSTLIIDPETGEIRYCIRKSVRNDHRLARQRQFERTGALPSLAATYYGTRGQNPFALLHGDE